MAQGSFEGWSERTLRRCRAAGVMRFHEAHGCAAYFGDCSAPSQLVQTSQVALVRCSQPAVSPVVHDAELRVRPENFGRPLGLRQLRKEVPESEDMSKLVDDRIELLLGVFLEHLRIEEQVMPAG